MSIKSEKGERVMVRVVQPVGLGCFAVHTTTAAQFLTSLDSKQQEEDVFLTHSFTFFTFSLQM